MAEIKITRRGVRGEDALSAARRTGTFMGAAITADMSDQEVLDAALEPVAELVTAAAAVSVMDPVRTAATTDSALSGLIAVGGVTVEDGDRVLLAGQSTGSQNGIYIAAAGAWSRATDLDTGAEAVTGLYVLVTEGENEGAFVLATTGSVTIGSTALTFRRFRSVSKTDQAARQGRRSALRDIPVSLWAGLMAGTNTTDLTAYLQAGLDTEPSEYVLPGPGPYIWGAGNTPLLPSSNVVITGTRGVTRAKAHADFTTSAASEAAYKFMIYADGETDITVRDIMFEKSSASAKQSKVGFKNCARVQVTGCASDENGTWDFLFNTCEDFAFEDNRVALGVEGNALALGVGVRVCGKSRKGRIADNDISGALVTQLQEGLGVQPSGDKWGSVAVNIDCSSENHQNSNQFKGGSYRIRTDGTGNPVVLNIPGVEAEGWKAWITQVRRYDTLSGTSVRTAAVAITDDTITVTGLPGGPALDYLVLYAYFGDTPEDVLVEGNVMRGLAYAALSVINGMRIRSRNNFIQHVGDVAIDPEGCLQFSSEGDVLDDVNIAGICVGNGSTFKSTVHRYGTIGVSTYADGGAAYQAFNYPGNDFWSAQLDGVTITVAAASGNDQVITGSAACFTAIGIGDRIEITISGVQYTWEVVAKASNTSITIDKRTRRLHYQPRATPTDNACPADDYEAGEWKKAPFVEAIRGLTGDCEIDAQFVPQDIPPIGPAISGAFNDGLKVRGQIGSCIRAIELSDGRNIDIDMQAGGRVYLQRIAGLKFTGSIRYAVQRQLIMDGLHHFEVSNVQFHDNIDGNVGSPAIAFGNCRRGVISNITMIQAMGDAGNAQPVIVQATYDNGANSFSTSAPNNEDVRCDHQIVSVKSGAAVMDVATTVTAADATPDVTIGARLVVSYSAAQDVTGLDGAYVGARRRIEATNGNATLKHGSNFVMLGGADVPLASGEGADFVKANDGKWKQLTEAL